MAVDQLGKGFPGGLEAVPEPHCGWWWRRGPADLIHCHRVPSQRGQLGSQLVTRRYVAFSLAKEESEYLAGASNPRLPPFLVCP